MNILWVSSLREGFFSRRSNLTTIASSLRFKIACLPMVAESKGKKMVKKSRTNNNFSTQLLSKKNIPFWEISTNRISYHNFTIFRLKTKSANTSKQDITKRTSISKMDWQRLSPLIIEIQSLPPSVSYFITIVFKIPNGKRKTPKMAQYNRIR